MCVGKWEAAKGGGGGVMWIVWLNILAWAWRVSNCLNEISTPLTIDTSPRLPAPPPPQANDPSSQKPFERPHTLTRSRSKENENPERKEREGKKGSQDSSRRRRGTARTHGELAAPVGQRTHVVRHLRLLAHVLAAVVVRRRAPGRAQQAPRARRGREGESRHDGCAPERRLGRRRGRRRRCGFGRRGCRLWKGGGWGVGALRALGQHGAVVGRADVKGHLGFGADEGAAGVVGCGAGGDGLRGAG